MEEYPGTFHTSRSMTRFESHWSTFFSKGFYNKEIHDRVISKAEWCSQKKFPPLQYKKPLLSQPFLSTSATPLHYYSDMPIQSRIAFATASESIELVPFNSHLNLYMTAAILETSFLTMSL